MQVQLGHCLIKWKWPLEPLSGRIVCRIYGSVHENAHCGIHYINEICGLYEGVYVVTHMTFGLSWSSSSIGGGGGGCSQCSVKYASRCVPLGKF